METIKILLIEDNEGDIVLTKEALAEGKLLNEIIVVRDGEEALNYLFQRNGFENAARPDLILLDINLPRIDGKEVLNKIKTDENLKVIPVIMLTTSSAEQDVLTSYMNHANCYIVKPVALDKFMEVVNSVEDFWISIVKLTKR